MNPRRGRRPCPFRSRGTLALAGALTVAGALACGGSPGGNGAAAGGSFPGGGVVSAASPEAAEAGASILRAGGNAVDAAVAVSLALGVTEPAGSGLFGQTVILLQRPGEDPLVIDGTTYAPSVLPPDPGSVGLTGRRASTVPSTVRVLDLAWSRFGSGTQEWSALVEPAAILAEEGWILEGFRHASLGRYRDRVEGDPAALALLFLEDGSIPPPGSRVRSLPLARTLRRLADAGAGDFYRGELAREIARDMEAGGGWITLADLEGFPEPRILPALRGSYRGWDIHTLPPPFGGWVVLAALHALDASPPAESGGAMEGERLAALAEALRFGHTLRRDEEVPDMRDYQEAVAQRIERERAREWMARAGRSGGGETTHFTVVDGDGMLVAVSQSINNYYGAGVAHPELGILYNDYMAEFRTGEPEHPFGLRPGAMPLSSMSATIISRDGVPAMALGGPGSARIISSVTQVVSRWVQGSSLTEAVGAHRVHVVPAADGDRLYLEGSGWSPESLQELERAGFVRSNAPMGMVGVGQGGGELDPYFGGIHAVGREGSAWTGAADPRRDGAVVRTSPPPEG